LILIIQTKSVNHSIGNIKFITMSRIGKAPISVPQGVEISVSKGNVVTVKGPKGVLTQQIDPDLTIKIEDGTINISRPTDQKRHRSMHGLYRSLVNNMVEGVSKGYIKELELVGVGYRASNTGQLLELSLGYSHPVMFFVPSEVKVEAIMEKGKNPLVKLESHDKQLIGQIAAKIRAFRKPEPYKGKGVRFKGEEIRRKQGKTAG
jgi:large subunit ribosomal protein L6